MDSPDLRAENPFTLVLDDENDEGRRGTDRVPNDAESGRSSGKDSRTGAVPLDVEDDRPSSENKPANRYAGMLATTILLFTGVSAICLLAAVAVSTEFETGMHSLTNARSGLKPDGVGSQSFVANIWPPSAEESTPEEKFHEKMERNPLAANSKRFCAMLGDERSDVRIQCFGKNDKKAPLGYGDQRERHWDSVGLSALPKPSNETSLTPETEELGELRKYINLGRAPGGGQLQLQEISCGLYHCCVLTRDGLVKCWGKNKQAELGYGDQKSRGFKAFQMGDNLPYVDLGKGMRAIQVDAGNWLTCVLLENRQVKCWGDNGQGELGLGDPWLRGNQGTMGDMLPSVNLGKNAEVKRVSAYSFGCAVLMDDSLKCWGWNDFGCLGLGDTIARGNKLNQMGDNLPAVDLGKGVKVKNVHLGNTHNCATLSDGTLKCWGHQGEQFGENVLGYGDNFNRGGLIKSGGPKRKPEEAIGMGDWLPAVDLGRDAKVDDAKVLFDSNCVLLTDKRVKCFGEPKSLGYGDLEHRGDGYTMGDSLPAVDVGSVSHPIRLVAGYEHSCVVFENRRVKCWGWSINGHVGNHPHEMGDHLTFLDFAHQKQVWLDRATETDEEPAT